MGNLILHSVPEQQRQSLYIRATQTDVDLLLFRFIEEESQEYLEDLKTQEFITNLQLIPNAEEFVFIGFGQLESLRIQIKRDSKNIVLEKICLDELVFLQGSSCDNSEVSAFAEFGHKSKDLRQNKDGIGIWKEAKQLLRNCDEELIRSCALRWLLCVLETQHPDVSLVESLIEAVIDEKLQIKASQSIELDDGLVLCACSLLNDQLSMLHVPSSSAALNLGRIQSAFSCIERILQRLNLRLYLDRLPFVADLTLKDDNNLEHLEVFVHEIISSLTVKDSPKSKPVEKSEESTSPASQNAPVRQQNKILKVDPSRIDALMDLAGELVVAKNALPFLAKKAEDGLSAKELSREIKQQHAVINRIVENLQAAVIQVRMVPLAQIFRRFTRLVRDTSSQLGKKVHFEVSGEETEADKDMVEDLFDPLVHLMRNALDHGLESPQERASKGKNPTGKIKLTAHQDEDLVYIMLKDDGAGIDVEKVKKKALAQGLIGELEVDLLSDREVMQLIFEPGFSTADKVSEISGRGVGMDAVRTMIHSIGGCVDVHSQLHQGTTIQIILPITMAISHVMMTEVRGIPVGVPFSDIVETVRVSNREVRRIKSRDVVVLRQRIIPLLRLYEAFEVYDVESDNGIRAKKHREDMISMLVVSALGEEIGLVVDSLHEGVDVIIKPMSGILKECTLFSGTALLGDGRVLLVLNLKELVRQQSQLN